MVTGRGGGVVRVPPRLADQCKRPGTKGYEDRGETKEEGGTGEGGRQPWCVRDWRGVRRGSGGDDDGKQAELGVGSGRRRRGGLSDTRAGPPGVPHMCAAAAAHPLTPPPPYTPARPLLCNAAQGKTRPPPSPSPWKSMPTGATPHTPRPPPGHGCQAGGRSARSRPCPQPPPPLWGMSPCAGWRGRSEPDTLPAATRRGAARDRRYSLDHHIVAAAVSPVPPQTLVLAVARQRLWRRATWPVATCKAVCTPPLNKFIRPPARCD